MDLPVKSYSVPAFCDAAKTLLNEDTIPEFISFVLSGVLDGHQAYVDPIKNRLRKDHPIVGMRDYDSLLGIDPNILVHSDLTLYVAANDDDTLRNNIHVKYSFGPHTVPVHRIPNVCIGKWGTHNMLRVLIPGLYNQDRKNVTLSREERVLFYEHGYWAAIHKVMGRRGADWPASYADELFRSRGATGKFAYQTKALASWFVDELGEAIRHELVQSGVPWGDSIVFLHQIRGVKNTTVHNFEHDAAQDALDEFLSHNSLSLNELSSGYWWIDVGLELMSDDGECLAWRTDSHREIIERILNISEYHADRITSLSSSQYTRDMTSHLPALSGCRITPGARGQGEFEARYVQLYLTDKSVTARKDGYYHGKYILGRDILAGKADTYITNLYDLYRRSTRSVQAHARAEVRVPIEHAVKPFVNFDTDLLEESLVALHANDWWGLRAYRAMAYKYLLEQQAQATPAQRLYEPALLLTAFAPWFLNSLHCTPDLGPSSRDLLTAVLPHVPRVDADHSILAFVVSTKPRADVDDESDSDGDTSDGSTDSDSGPRRPRRVLPGHNTVAANKHGLVFTRLIRIGDKTPAPRLRNDGTPFIKPSTFTFIFGQEQSVVDEALRTNGLILPRNPTRVKNKVRRTQAYNNQGQDDDDSLFHLDSERYHFQPPPIDEGSDLSEPDVDESGFNPTLEEALKKINPALTACWRQFLLDVTSKAPNRAGAFAASYCILSEAERAVVNEETYRTRDLSKFFSQCQWKIGTNQEWEKSFKNFWPSKDKQKCGAVQNYGSCTYYRLWGTICASASDELVEDARKAMRKRFNCLYWLPPAQADRIWWTKPDKRFTKTMQGSNPCPRVLVRRVAPTWDDAPHTR